jgi:TfoX/Sxy family transcriptional regulator of competence genes
MAYDLELADRIRKVVRGERGLSEKRMFGGLAFLIDEIMAVSASNKGGLLLRIDRTQTVSLVSEPHVRPAEMRGREMDGWLRVDAEVLETDDELRRWVNHGVAFNWRTLRRHYLTGEPGWRPTENGIMLFVPQQVKVTRYRWRGYSIPRPWARTATP